MRYEQVVLYYPRTGREDRTHTSLIVEQAYRGDQIEEFPLEGPSLFLVEGVYLVSPALRESLELKCFSYLRFSEGLPVMLR